MKENIKKKKSCYKGKLVEEMVGQGGPYQG